MSRAQWGRAIFIVTLLWLAAMLVSLRTGWLNGLFFDGSVAHVQGIDFFPVVRGWLNLTAGRSEYDTFHSGYGPYATWLLYHPLLALVLGPLLVWSKPWTAYRLWTGVSVLMVAAAAYVLARRGKDPVRRALTFLLLLGAFPTYVTLYSGNVQALLVLAAALIFASVDGLRAGEDTGHNRAMLLAGLLLSLFSKPIVLAMLPLLLLLRQTRRTAARAVAIYLAVSLLSLVVPAWNPVAMTWSERWQTLLHPAALHGLKFLFTSSFAVTRPMQDNSIHWLAMAGLADFRILHIDIVSLPALLDGWLGVRTPDALYRVPSLLVLELTVLVLLIRERRTQMEAALMVLLSATLLLFLSYGAVWEYHYTLVLPVAGLLLARGRGDWLERAVVGLACLSWAPGLYVFFHQQAPELLSVQTALRAERVLPVLVAFLLLLARGVALALNSPGGLRFFPAPASELNSSPAPEAGLSVGLASAAPRANRPAPSEPTLPR